MPVHFEKNMHIHDLIIMMMMMMMMMMMTLIMTLIMIMINKCLKNSHCKESVQYAKKYASYACSGDSASELSKYK